jgi:NAD(P)H dehydrogenase (quinone)
MTTTSSSSPTLAVTGATGQLGRLLIAQLKGRVPAASLVALVRTPAKAADLGVSAREADYTRPETLVAALQGIETLMMISSSDIGQRVAQHRNLVEAAKRAGVKHIVYTSILHADTSRIDLAQEHRETEAMIKASDIAYTFLRNGWYTENYVSTLAGAVAAGAVISSAGEGRISTASRADYAAAAVAVLTSPGHENCAYELAGDRGWTMTELASEVARVSGKAIVFQPLSESDYAATLAGLGLPELIAKGIASWDFQASKGALFDDGRQLSTLIGRPTTTLAASVQRALAG